MSSHRGRLGRRRWLLLTSSVILVLLEKFVVPELSRWVRDRVAATGQPPTEEEYIQHLRETTDSGIAKGLQFLKDTEEISAEEPSQS